MKIHTSRDSKVLNLRIIDVEGNAIMSTNIKWESDLDIALSMARVQEKYVLLDFSNPG